jgi:serine protein kinase
MTEKPSIDHILAESDGELGRFAWEGTFADYLRLVVEVPSRSRLAHDLVHEAVMAKGVETTPDGVPVYGLFKDRIFGLERALERIVRYLDGSASRLEIRKRILLLLGPPASGKSTIVEMIKRALEEYTRTDEGAIYAIAGCPIQEDPLHLVPVRLRPALFDHYGVYVEGDLCPRCQYALKSEYNGKASEMPVRRVVFSERSALGIGYFIASNPRGDSSVLVGSIDNKLLSGEREEVAAKAFRLDGELNIANRGLMEFVEIFKADRQLLTTLLGLAQEQIIKNDKFGSIYANEVLIGHSNEGDFDEFAADKHSEALKDRIIAVEVPYNLRVREEVKICAGMLASGMVQGVHLAPLTLRMASVFAVLSRLDPPARQGMSLLDKMRLYDGNIVKPYDKDDVAAMQRHNHREGMSGLSPRYVMNRLDNIAGSPDVSCVFPLAAVDSLWRGLRENISLEEEARAQFVGFLNDTIREYNDLAINEVQRAFDENFEQAAEILLDGYLNTIASFSETGFQPTDATDRTISDRDVRDIERAVGVAEREKPDFRREILGVVEEWRKRGLTFDYSSEPRLKAAIEEQLLPTRRNLLGALSRPRGGRQRAEWQRLRNSINGRLVNRYGYCQYCSDDLLSYVVTVLDGTPVHKAQKNEEVEWLWPLTHAAAEPAEESEE